MEGQGKDQLKDADVGTTSPGGQEEDQGGGEHEASWCERRVLRGKTSMEADGWLKKKQKKKTKRARLCEAQQSTSA